MGIHRKGGRGAVRRNVFAYWPQSRPIHTYYLQVQQACEAGGFGSIYQWGKQPEKGPGHTASEAAEGFSYSGENACRV